MSDLFTPTIARTSSSDTGNNVGYLKDSSADKLTLTMEDFLQLMIAQFQNQDIDNPASTSDMMNQLISMSTIQSMKTMTDASASGLKEIVGEVTGTGTYNGKQVVFVNGKSYALSSIMAVGELPPTEKTPSNGTEGTGGSDTTGSGEDGDKI